MKSSTKAIIEVALSGDPSVSSGQQDSVLAILGKKTPPSVPLLLKQGDVADILSVSRQTIHNMVKDGLIHPVVIKEGRKFESQTRYGTKFMRNSGLVRYRRDEVLGLAGGAN
ncbi:MAG: helix-turn-helix domain-containing protein [Candidatus Theseobacter exili]|nr:helix-turn-helix domain-containing protein [Candidatus Theseobacter exili]